MITLARKRDWHSFSMEKYQQHFYLAERPAE